MSGRSSGSTPTPVRRQPSDTAGQTLAFNLRKNCALSRNARGDAPASPVSPPPAPGEQARQVGTIGIAAVLNLRLVVVRAIAHLPRITASDAAFRPYPASRGAVLSRPPRPQRPHRNSIASVRSAISPSRITLHSATQQFRLPERVSWRIVRNV
jgi:hypothetical protein